MPDPATLDPGLRTMLDQLAALGGRPVTELTPTEARLEYQLLSAADGTAEEVGAIDDVEIAGVPCRRYRPAGSDAGAELPVVAWFHGGGWVIGDLDTADTTCRKLANRSGAVVVSVDYRRAPEHGFPAAVDDCWAVTAELARTSPALAVAGDSAGGNLAAVVAVRARDEGVALAHQTLVYPVTDASTEHPSYVENAEGYLLTADAMRWFIAHYTTAEQRTDPSVSPLLTPDLAGVSPAHVVTAGFDPLRDEGGAYAARLADAGVPVEHDLVPGAIHGFFALSGVTPLADEAMERVTTLLAKAF